jgi:Transposase IS116/IS110/IS902 family
VRTFCTAIEDLADRDALAVLGRAPTPEQGAGLGLAAIRSALKKAGRRRYIDARARDIQAALRTEQLAAAAPVAAAFAATTRAAVGLIAELNRQIGALEASLAEHFETHPDADIYLSLPGLGGVLGARVLGEFGDDPNRYTDPKSRKNYAGISPLTVASGKKRAVLARPASLMRTLSGLPGRGSVCPAGPRLRSRLAQTLDDRGVGHPAALTHLPVVPRARRRGLTPIRTPISSPCPSASTNKRAAQRVPASTQTCSAAIWGLLDQTSCRVCAPRRRSACSRRWARSNWSCPTTS